MGARKKGEAVNQLDRSGVELPTSVSSAVPLVFISHDHRDADLAEEFGNLLTDASGGVLQSFRSSDRKGNAGIEFGSEWYTAIMSKLDAATDVVALLTPNSLDRPWILYEAGVAKGKLNTTVLGVAIGIELEKANAGPFAQFQNCANDADSLTKLVLQLIKRNPLAAPRDAAVRRQVEAFAASVEKIRTRGPRQQPEPAIDNTSVARIFEEVKVLVRDLPERLEGEIRAGVAGHSLKRRRRHRAMMLDEILRCFDGPDESHSTTGMLIVASILREEFPWVFELVAELHRAVQVRDDRAVKRAARSLVDAVHVSHRHGLLKAHSAEEEHANFAIHRIADFVEIHFMARPQPVPSRKRAATEQNGDG